MRAALGLVVALGCACLWAQPAAASERVLLAVGSNIGLPHETPLAYGTSDAESFATLLSELGGVRGEDVHLLRDPDPAALEAKLQELERSVQPGATLFFYYSGHGSETELHLSGSRFSRERLRLLLQRTSAKLRIVIVDACRGLSTRGAYSPGPPLRVVRSREQAGLVVIQSASRGEPALESGRLKGGLFTHHLVSGLRGAADASGNGWVSLYEAYAFAYAHTLADSGLDQTPAWMLELQGTGPLELTAVARARAQLILPRERATLYTLYAKGSQEEFVSAWSSPARETPLAVPSWEFVVWRRAAQGDGVAEVNLALDDAERLSAGSFRPVSRSTMLQKGGEFAVHPHRIGADAGVAYSLDRAYLQPSLGVHYQWEGALGSWSPTAGLSLTRGSFSTDQNRAERSYYRAFLGALTPSWRPGFVQLRAGAALTGGWIQQRLESAAAERTEHAWSWGAQGRLSAAAPISHQSTLDVHLTARASALRERPTAAQQATRAEEAPVPAPSARSRIDAEVHVTAGFTFAL
jgi:hypothetical protein